MAIKSYLKYLVCLGCLLSIFGFEISAQNSISTADSLEYRQKISDLENELALKGIGNSRVYSLAAYNSLIGETQSSISYLKMAVDNGLLILEAIGDTDLENARNSSEWPSIRKKIIGNWYKYYPFGDVDYALSLIEMKRNYLFQRNRAIEMSEESGNTSAKYRAEVDQVHKIALQNGEKLDSLISIHGWPRQNLVGQAQTRAAALILVYSDLGQQKKYVHEIEKAVEYGEIEGRYFALITDKILVAEGEKQLYGTQYMYNDSTQNSEILPIENEVEVDKRRIEMGLDSMNVYLKGLNEVME